MASEEEIEAVEADAREKIGTFGFTIVAVFGGPVSFAYTAGLTAVGEPELMILGIPPEYARIALDKLASRVMDGQRYKPGDVPEDFLEDGYEVMICGPIPGVRCGSQGYPPGVAGALYGREAVRVYQVVYQDRNRLYPWQDGYSMPSQPYLGGGRG